MFIRMIDEPVSTMIWSVIATIVLLAVVVIKAKEWIEKKKKSSFADEEKREFEKYL